MAIEEKVKIADFIAEIFQCLVRTWHCGQRNSGDKHSKGAFVFCVIAVENGKTDGRFFPASVDPIQVDKHRCFKNRSG